MILKKRKTIFLLSSIVSIPFLSSLTSISAIKNENNIPKNIPTIPTTLDELRAMDKEDIIKLSKLDMRDYDLVTSVKNQGAQGICWAYAMAAASEVNMLYKKGVIDDKYTGNNFGLSSKNIDRVVNIRNGKYDKLGLTNDDVISRSLGNATVKMFFSSQMLLQQNGPIIGDPNYNLGPGNNAAWLESITSVPNTELDIKKAIAKYGSVAFAYRHSGYTAYYAIEKNITHAATIVGWDDNYSKEKFGPTKPRRNGAWIVKNSWGPGVYDNGYFYLSYDSYIEDIIALDYENKNKFENAYYYDGLGRLNSSEEIQNKKVAAIFQTQKASYNKVERIKGLSFGLIGKNAKIKASIYLNANVNPSNRYSKYNNPESGIKVLEQESEVFSNKDRFGGVYTMTLNKEIELPPGSSFSIVLEPINDDDSAQILFSSEPNSYNDLTYYKKGDEWINSWTADWGTGSYSVASIKALTVTEKKVGTTNNNLVFSNVELNDKKIIYTGGEVSPNLTVKFENKSLVKGQDYDVEYEQLLENEDNLKFDRAQIGTLKITIRGKGIYKGEKTIFSNFEKGPKPINSLSDFGDKYDSQNNIISINIVDNFNNRINSYNDIKLPNGFEFINKNLNIQEGENNWNKIKYIKQDAFCFDLIEFDTKIIKTIEIKNINETILQTPILDSYYTSNEIKPIPNLILNGIPLKLDEDYTISYTNNINVGQGQIEIIGKKYFNERKIINFNILKAKNEIIRWEVKDNSIIFESLFGRETAIFEYYKDKECTQKLDYTPIESGTYYIKALVPATNNYENIESNPLAFVINSPQPEPFPSDTNNKNKKMSTIVVALISIFSVLGVSIGAGIILFIIIKKKRKK